MSEDDQVMDSVLKRRLVGAAVIIALAVIFVPMLLESPDSGRPVKSDIKIPEKNSYEIPNRLESKVVEGEVIQSRATESVRPVIAPDSPLVNQFPTSAAKTSQPGTATSDTPATADSVPVKVPAIVVETSTLPVAPVIKKPKKKKPVTTQKAQPSSQTGFVAQVGSFTQKQNAVVLADKLQASGYASFVEEVAGTNGVVFRVKIGPVNDRTDAEVLLDKIKRNEGLGGIVVSYP